MVLLRRYLLAILIVSFLFLHHPLEELQGVKKADARGGWVDDLKSGSSVSEGSIAAPTWSFTNDSSRAVGQRARCEIEFEVPYDLGPGVFMYYKLTN